MKDNLFEILLSLFETSLTQLQKDHVSQEQESNESLIEDVQTEAEEALLVVKSADDYSVRVLTQEEQLKITKASYQFLMRMKLWGIIDSTVFELVLNEILYSESRIVTLEETKWIIRTILENQLNEKQLAFLELVLYQKEQALISH